MDSPGDESGPSNWASDPAEEQQSGQYTPYRGRGGSSRGSPSHRGSPRGGPSNRRGRGRGRPHFRGGKIPWDSSEWQVVNPYMPESEQGGLLTETGYRHNELVEEGPSYDEGSSAYTEGEEGHDEGDENDDGIMDYEEMEHDQDEGDDEDQEENEDKENDEDEGVEEDERAQAEVPEGPEGTESSGSGQGDQPQDTQQRRDRLKRWSGYRPYLPVNPDLPVIEYTLRDDQESDHPRWTIHYLEDKQKFDWKFEHGPQEYWGGLNRDQLEYAAYDRLENGLRDAELREEILEELRKYLRRRERDEREADIPSVPLRPYHTLDPQPLGFAPHGHNLLDPEAVTRSGYDRPSLGQPPATPYAKLMVGEPSPLPSYPAKIAVPTPSPKETPSHDDSPIDDTLSDYTPTFTAYPPVVERQSSSSPPQLDPYYGPGPNPVPRPYPSLDPTPYPTHQPGFEIHPLIPPPVGQKRHIQPTEPEGYYAGPLPGEEIEGLGQPELPSYNSPEPNPNGIEEAAAVDNVQPKAPAVMAEEFLEENSHIIKHPWPNPHLNPNYPDSDPDSPTEPNTSFLEEQDEGPLDETELGYGSDAPTKQDSPWPEPEEAQPIDEPIEPQEESPEEQVVPGKQAAPKKQLFQATVEDASEQGDAPKQQDLRPDDSEGSQKDDTSDAGDVNAKAPTAIRPNRQDPTEYLPNDVYEALDTVRRNTNLIFPNQMVRRMRAWAGETPPPSLTGTDFLSRFPSPSRALTEARERYTPGQQARTPAKKAITPAKRSGVKRRREETPPNSLNIEVPANMSPGDGTRKRSRRQAIQRAKARVAVGE